MTSATQKTSASRAKRDAYDDFLDGVTTSGKKASSGKKSSSSGAKSASSSGKTPKRTGEKGSRGKAVSAPETEKASGKKTDSAAKKSASSKPKATDSSGKKKSVKKADGVEAGIVSLGNGGKLRRTDSRKTADVRPSGAKNTASRKKAGTSSTHKQNAVLVVDNPVAGRTARVRSGICEDERRRPGHAPSGRQAGSGVRTKRSASGNRNTRHMDRDDLFRENTSAAGRKRSSGSKRASGSKHLRKKKKPVSGWDVFFTAGIVCMLGFMLWQGTQYSDFLMMQQAVDRQTYYPGTSIEGIDVSDMTLEGAIDYWQTQVEPRYADRTVIFDGGESVKASQLGYSSDYMTVLTNAWSAGRSGSLEQRYQAIASRSETPVAYSVTRTPYEEDVVDKFVAYAAEKVDTPATEVKIESFDLKKFKFVFSDPQPGKKLDRQALKASVMQALDAGGGTVQMVVSDVEPQTTKESVASRYGMIASAITNASSSSKNRLTNIKLSLQLINGTCLKPGETFSFNGVVGERTKARGFKEATAYSSGEVTEQVGGGICQVSTTLFNAAVKADLEIVERHNHSLTVGYVDKGKDAAVNWGSQDLRFTNNTGDDVYICCYLTDNKRVRFGIFGKLLPDGETITVEGVTTGEIEYETEYQASGLLAPGEQIVLQTGKKGYTAEAYKLRWNAKGKLISRELLCKSKYKATKEIIQYGP